MDRNMGNKAIAEYFEKTLNESSDIMLKCIIIIKSLQESRKKLETKANEIASMSSNDSGDYGMCMRHGLQLAINEIDAIFSHTEPTC